MRVPLVIALSVLALTAGSGVAQDSVLESPENWLSRADRPGGADELYFVEMPPGWHITTGPASIIWDPSSMATAPYRVEMDVYLFDPGQRREAFGFFVGGSDLEGPEQAYTYFLIREGGEFLVKTRSGLETGTVQDWTGHEGIASFNSRPDMDDESVMNALRLDVGVNEFRFSVNGEVVFEGPVTSDTPMVGVAGFRVNHGLNLHVSKFEVHEGG